MYGEDLKESGAKSECPFIQNLHDFAPKQKQWQQYQRSKHLWIFISITYKFSI